MAQSDAPVLSTGYALLDAHLPGGGWPVGGMVEILQTEPLSHQGQHGQQHTWQLLLPVLAQAVRQQVGPVLLVAPPYAPFAPALAAQGLPTERLLCVRADKPMARLWAAEQALRCADVVAVLAWLPQASSTELRRLHMAAQQHSRLLFVFRGLRTRNDASPAQLRLLVEGTEAMKTMQVHILKRRGPPLADALDLPAHPARLAALLDSRTRKATHPATHPVTHTASTLPTRAPLALEVPHALACTAAFA